MHKGSKLIWHVAVKGSLRIGLSSKTHVSIEVSPGRHETQMTFDVEGIGISGSRNSSSFLVATFNVDFTLVVGVRTLFVTTRSAGVRTRLHEEGKPGEALLTSPSVFPPTQFFLFVGTCKESTSVVSENFQRIASKCIYFCAFSWLLLRIFPSIHQINNPAIALKEAWESIFAPSHLNSSLFRH